MLVGRIAKGETQNGESAADTAVEDPNVKAAIRALEQVVGTKVAIHETGGKGKIEMHFCVFRRNEPPV